MPKSFSPRRVKTLFLSDVHMGMRGTQVSALVDLLATIRPDRVYLVGDIVDGWQLRKSWYWQPACNRVVQALLSLSQGGAHIIYVPGNHDDFLRDFVGLRFGGIEIADRPIHTTADGKRYLVIHGDQFDVVVRHGRLLARIGDWSYNVALSCTRLVNRWRERVGLANFSLSAWARANVRRAAEFVERFEAAVTHEAVRTGVDGVICGHVHSAASRMRGGIHYINTGDWVESCTAVIEHDDGRLELIVWKQQGRALVAPHNALPPVDTKSLEGAKP